MIYTNSSAHLNLIVGGSGPPLVFIHGFGLDHRMWDSQMKFFSSDYTAIAMDLRGFGKSAPPDQVFAYHEDIVEVLDFLQIDQPVVLVGHSMGARAVANFALTFPEKTKALVFVDGVSIKKEIAGAGHMCNMEAPEEFNALVSQFLVSLTSFAGD